MKSTKRKKNKDPKKVISCEQSGGRRRAGRGGAGRGGRSTWILPLVPPWAEVQPYELTVPVKGDVLVDGGLAEDLLHILCRADTHKKRQDCFFNNNRVIEFFIWQPNHKMQQLHAVVDHN